MYMDELMDFVSSLMKVMSRLDYPILPLPLPYTQPYVPIPHLLSNKATNILNFSLASKPSSFRIWLLNDCY